MVRLSLACDRALHLNLGSELQSSPHMPWHACGFALVNEKHDTRALQAYRVIATSSTWCGYTELAPNRFKDFWRYRWNRDHAAVTLLAAQPSK